MTWYIDLNLPPNFDSEQNGDNDPCQYFYIRFVHSSIRFLCTFLIRLAYFQVSNQLNWYTIEYSIDLKITNLIMYCWRLVILVLFNNIVNEIRLNFKKPQSDLPTHVPNEQSRPASQDPCDCPFPSSPLLIAHSTVQWMKRKIKFLITTSIAWSIHITYHDNDH